MSKIKFRLIIYFIGLVIVILSLFQNFAFEYNLPKDHISAHVNGYQPDYYYYLSLLQFGKEGKFFIYSRYTYENFIPQLVNTFFVFAGFIGGLFSLWSPIIYLILRVLFGSLILYFSYILVEKLYVRKVYKIISYIFIFASVPLWSYKEGIFITFASFWAEFDPFVRLNYLPHHMAAVLMLILSILFFLKSNAKSLFVCGLLNAIGAWFNPALILFSIGTFLFYYLINFIYDCKSIFSKKIIIEITLILLPVFIIILYFNYLQNSQFPWTAFRDWEKNMNFALSGIDILKISGISGFIALFGVVKSILKKDKLTLLLSGWYITPFIFLSIPVYYLPLSNARFFQGYIHIPGGFLAAYFLFGIYEKINNSLFKKFFIASIIIIYLINAIPSYIGSYQQLLNSVHNDKWNSLQYIKKDSYDAISYLGQTGKSDEIIAAPGYISTFIPAFTNKKVIIGHPTFTYKEREKYEDILKILHTQSDTEFKNLELKYRFDYIWYEKSQNENPIYMNFSTIIYENESVVIYKIN